MDDEGKSHKNRKVSDWEIFAVAIQQNTVSYLALQEPLPLHRLRQKRGYKPHWQVC